MKILLTTLFFLLSCGLSSMQTSLQDSIVYSRLVSNYQNNNPHQPLTLLNEIKLTQKLYTYPFKEKVNLLLLAIQRNNDPLSAALYTALSITIPKAVKHDLFNEIKEELKQLPANAGRNLYRQMLSFKYLLSTAELQSINVPLQNTRSIVAFNCSPYNNKKPNSLITTNSFIYFKDSLDQGASHSFAKNVQNGVISSGGTYAFLKAWDTTFSLYHVPTTKSSGSYYGGKYHHWHSTPLAVSETGIGFFANSHTKQIMIYDGTNKPYAINKYPVTSDPRPDVFLECTPQAKKIISFYSPLESIPAFSSLIIADTEQQKIISSFKAEPNGTFLHICPSDNLISTVHDRQTIKLWDIRSNKAIFFYKNAADVLTIDPQKKWLAIAHSNYHSSSQTVVLCDLLSGKTISKNHLNTSHPVRHIHFASSQDKLGISTEEEITFLPINKADEVPNSPQTAYEYVGLHKHPSKVCSLLQPTYKN